MLFVRKYLAIGLGALALVGVLVGAFAVSHAIRRIERQATAVANLQRDLAAERHARQADVAGLTALSEGLVNATSARALDEEALRETIDAKNPQPVSPSLGAFLGRLREQDAPAPRP